MIISASRRTDIPSYYSEWFFNRLKEGYVLIRNPFNTRQVSRVSLSPDVVDCIVFWSKNPQPMLAQLDKLQDYSFYFQFTLNSYAQDIETGLPRKKEIIETFKRLSDKIGPERVIWRYDPVLLNEKYTIAWHEQHFGSIAHQLKGYTQKVTISFIDLYSKITKNIHEFNIEDVPTEDKRTIAENFAQTARELNFTIDTCAEDIDLAECSIEHGRCIDNRLIERITGCPLKIAKDKAQRLMCGCVASIDIGAYNTCSNGCRYCYANFSREQAEKNRALHNPRSALLIGEVKDGDVVNERKAASNKQKVPSTTAFDFLPELPAQQKSPPQAA
jgi:DNA repair photolyase